MDTQPTHSVDAISDEDFKCSICMCLFYEPVCLQFCQHTFCRQCISKTTNPTCPLCRTVTIGLQDAATAMQPNPLLVSIIKHRFPGEYGSEQTKTKPKKSKTSKPKEPKEDAVQPSTLLTVRRDRSMNWSYTREERDKLIFVFGAICFQFTLCCAILLYNSLRDAGDALPANIIYYYEIVVWLLSFLQTICAVVICYTLIKHESYLFMFLIVTKALTTVLIIFIWISMVVDHYHAIAKASLSWSLLAMTAAMQLGMLGIEVVSPLEALKVFIPFHAHETEIN